MSSTIAAKTRKAHFRFWRSAAEQKSHIERLKTARPDGRPVLIKKIKLLIAVLRSPPSLSSVLSPSCLLLASSSSVSFSTRKHKATLTLRALLAHRWQCSLMSARLIGRNFINARSIEIGDVEISQKFRGTKNSDVILREYSSVH